MKRCNWKHVASLFIALLSIVLFLGIEAKRHQIRVSEIHYRRALILYSEKRLLKADAEMDEALRLTPDNAYYLAYKGLINERMAELDGEILESFLGGRISLSGSGARYTRNAIKLYQAALSFSPHDGLIQHNLGWLYYLIGDRQKSIDCLNEAISSSLQDPLYYISLGLIQERLGNFQHAISEYQRAVALSPKIENSSFFCALRRSDAQKAKVVLWGAIGRLEDEMKRDPNPITSAKLGSLYLQTDPDRAFAALKWALASLPNLPLAWFNLGTLYETKKDWVAMGGCFKKAVFLNRADPLILAGMARVYESEGKIQEAILHYEKAIVCTSDALSEHANQVSALYHGTKYVEADDITPKGLLSYCRPGIDLFAIYNSLSKLYAQDGNDSRSRYYGEMIKRRPSESK
jgi:tetratricopeptide (TPR) repeat protein